MKTVLEREREAIISRLIELLREHRQSKALSMNETAWKAGLDHTMILRVEKRQRLPTIDTLLRMADALEADLPAMLKASIEAVRGRPKPVKAPKVTGQTVRPRSAAKSTRKEP